MAGPQERRGPIGGDYGGIVPLSAGGGRFFFVYRSGDLDGSFHPNPNDDVLGMCCDGHDLIPDQHDAALQAGEDSVGLVFRDRARRVYFRRTAFDRVFGAPVEVAPDLPGNQDNPTIVWAGGHFVVMWRQLTTIAFGRFDRNGVPQRAPAVTGVPVSDSLRAIAVGDAVYLTWIANSEGVSQVYIARGTLGCGVADPP